MESSHQHFLEMASGAISRRDYLSAMRYGLKAAHVPRGLEQVRCEAYILLAITSLEMGLPEDALAFSVGAHLSAHWCRDAGREEKAAAVVAMVLAEYPALAESPPNYNFH